MLDGPQGPAECSHLLTFTLLPYNYFYFQYVALPFEKKQTKKWNKTKNPYAVQWNRGRKAMLKTPRWWSYSIASESIVLCRFCFTSSAEKNQPQQRKSPWMPLPSHRRSCSWLQSRTHCAQLSANLSQAKLSTLQCVSSLPSRKKNTIYLFFGQLLFNELHAGHSGKQFLISFVMTTFILNQNFP